MNKNTSHLHRTTATPPTRLQRRFLADHNAPEVEK